MQSVDFATPPEDLKRGTRLGRYELLLRIGRGGMATVWVARERGQTREQDRLVAVKAILSDLASDDDFVKMFLDEGRIIRMIRHPNVVDVYEPGEERGVMFMAMEWVEGDSLHAVIAEAGKRRPIPPEMAVRIIADAASGLHAAHELKDDKGELMNVVHRDVSPHNILIGVDGAIKLVDFGVAKAMGRVSEATSAGQLKGKFGYMSPEQAMAKKVDRRADVFALGIVLFELTTGRRLFRGEHDAETLHLVVSGKIPAPSSVEPHFPKELEAIVMKALERDVAKRFQTAAELQHALEAYLKSERVVVPRAGIANLLKKVLGGRIEQRRKAIRSALRALDGEAPVGSNVPPSDPLASAVPSDHASVTGVSAVTDPSNPSSVSNISLVGSVSNVSVPNFTPSGPSQAGVSGTRPAGLPYGAPGTGEVSAGGYSASGQSRLSELSHPSQGTVIVKRSGIGGYVIGVLGLAVALGVALFFILNPRTRTTTIVSVPAASQAAPQPQLAAPAPTAETDPNVPTVELDKLAADAGADKPAAPRGVPKGWKPPHAPVVKPPAATQTASKPPPATTAAPPRANPYE